MYNEDKKREYLSVRREGSTSNNNLINWFNKVAQLEQKEGKDLSYFSVVQILNMYSTAIHTSSLTYLSWIHRSFAAYARWINPDNQFGEINSQVLDMCIDKDTSRTKIIMRSNLLRELEDTFINPMEQSLILGLYEGLLFTDFDNITADHIKENKLYIPGKRTLEISNELKHYMLQSAEAYILDAYTDEPKYKAPRFTELDPNDTRIIKMMKANPDADRMFRYRNIIKKCKEISGMSWVNAAELPQSGSASMLLDWMRKEGKDAATVANEHLEELKYRYGISWEYDIAFRKKFEFLFQ